MVVDHLLFKLVCVVASIILLSSAGLAQQKLNNI